MKFNSLISSVLRKKKPEAVDHHPDEEAGRIPRNFGQSEEATQDEPDPNFKKDLMERQKLCVVINIDNTLLDSVRLSDIAMEDHDYLSESGVQRSLKQGIFHISSELQRTTKLRPYVRTFLEELTLVYDIVLYSRVSPWYLRTMADALDRNSVYRDAGCLTLISEDDNDETGKLDAILKNREVVCIVDCRKRRWEKYADNLIKIDPYCYFVTKARTNNVNNNLPKSWIQLKGDECEEGGELCRVLRLLRVARNLFLKPEHEDGTHDIRQVIQFLRSKNKLDKYCIL